MNPLEFRKILLVGYAFDAPLGAPMLDGDGLPLSVVNCPVRMRFAFWIPQGAPHKRRAVGTFAELLRNVVRERSGGRVPIAELAGRVATVADYMRQHGLDAYAVNVPEKPAGYTLVAHPTDFELEALRAGVIEEQIQDFSFDRMPTPEEMRAHTFPHWEVRTLAAFGSLPNQAPTDSTTRPLIEFTGRDASKDTAAAE